MRRISFLIAILLIAFNMIAQNQKWEVYIGLSNKNNEPNDLMESYDKGLIIVATTYPVSTQINPCIFKTNVNGQLVHDQILTHNDDKLGIYTITQDSDGNLYAAGIYWIPNNPTGRPAILKFNPCGEPVWCKYLPVPPESVDGFIPDIVINNNNELIALVNQSTGGQTDQIYLAAFDLNGNELWIRPYATKSDYPLMVNQFGYKLIEHNDGYYIAGYCYYPYPNNPNHVFLRPLFIGINSSFHEKWVKPFYALDTILGMANSIIPVNDSVLMGVGIRRLAGNKDNSLLAFINVDGEELGYAQITNEQIGPDINDNVIKSIERINDTLFVAAANFGEETSYNPAGELIIDTGGNLFNFQSRPNTISLPEIVKTNDNNFVIVTSKKQGNYDKIYLYKINADLETVPFDTTQFVYDSLCPHQIQPGIIDLTDCPPTVSIDELPSPDQYYESIRWIPLKAYPNPVTEGKLTMEFENTEHHQNMELHCYDNFGRLIHSRKIYNGQQDTVLDVSTWPPGIYIAVVYSDGSARGKAKFVVR